jgi:hypothetical protein
MTPMRRLLAALLCIVVSVLPAGCATPERSGLPTAQEDRPVWPQPPAAPRVRYLRSIYGPKDMGIAKAPLRRLLDALNGAPEERFVRPSGVAEHDGVLFVADPGTPALWILDPKRQRTLKVVDIDGDSLISPVAVAVRPDGLVFVADSELRKVFLIDRDGKRRLEVARDLRRPAALAFDAGSAELYVADSAADAIRVFGAAGQPLRLWGTSGSAEGQFNHPTHIAFDASGALLVTDALNFRIQAFDRQGHFLWKFGHHGDGSGDLAGLRRRCAVRCGPDIRAQRLLAVRLGRARHAPRSVLASGRAVRELEE